MIFRKWMGPRWTVRTLLFSALAVVTGATLLLTHGGCGVPYYECTLIGCGDGLQLRILRPNGGPASDFRGTATWDGESQSFQCSSAPSLGESFNCTGNILTFATQTPPRELQLRIDPLPDGTHFDGTLQLPEPTLTQPNGANCSPTCQFTSVDVTLQTP